MAALRVRRWLSGPLVAALVAALVLAGVVTGAVFSMEDVTHHADAAEAHAGALVFVLHRTETADVIADARFPTDNIAAEGRFVVVKMSVTNTSAESRVFHSEFSTLSDGATQYGVDEAAWHYVGAADREMAPSESIEAALVFDVPVGVDPRLILLRESMWSTGVSIAL